MKSEEHEAFMGNVHLGGFLKHSLASSSLAHCLSRSQGSLSPWPWRGHHRSLSESHAWPPSSVTAAPRGKIEEGKPLHGKSSEGPSFEEYGALQT